MSNVKLCERCGETFYSMDMLEMSNKRWLCLVCVKLEFDEVQQQRDQARDVARHAVLCMKQTDYHTQGLILEEQHSWLREAGQ
jgi:hypothetical protein